MVVEGIHLDEDTTMMYDYYQVTGVFGSSYREAAYRFPEIHFQVHLEHLDITIV